MPHKDDALLSLPQDAKESWLYINSRKRNQVIPKGQSIILFLHADVAQIKHPFLSCLGQRIGLICHKS